MSPVEQKPILHGRDHMAGGPDPIPGLGTGGGIMFDTYPQDGNWLYLETTDATGAGGSPDGYGIELASADSIAMFATTGEFSFGGSDDPTFSLHTNSGYQEFVAGGRIAMKTLAFSIDATDFGDTSSIQLKADSILLYTVGIGSTGAISINSEQRLALQSDADDITLIAAAGTAYTQAATITFNATGGQKVSCTTLANVIALLQAYGLAL